jgi:hypothetical protein
MSDILEGIGESMDNPEEQQKIYEDVLKEVGLEVSEVMPSASEKKIAQKEGEGKKKEEDSLDQMLKELNK